MKVLIRSISLKEIRSRKTGAVYFFQTAAIDNGQDFPQPFEIMLDDPKKVYWPGEYAFGPDAIYVSREGKLSVSARLVPLPKPAAKGSLTVWVLTCTTEPTAADITGCPAPVWVEQIPSLFAGAAWTDMATITGALLGLLSVAYILRYIHKWAWSQ